MISTNTNTILLSYNRQRTVFRTQKNHSRTEEGRYSKTSYKTKQRLCPYRYMGCNTKRINIQRTFIEKLLLRHHKQCEIFIRSIEVGKNSIKQIFQEYFHFWIAELIYLKSPKIEEEQTINLITKYFPIAVQAYIQTQIKKFLNIWGKLGELEGCCTKESLSRRQCYLCIPFRL